MFKPKRHNNTMEFILKEAHLIIHRNGLIERKDLRNNIIKRAPVTANRAGYLCVIIDHKQVPIHKIIAMAYLGVNNDLVDIFHINHNIRDNGVDNLQIIAFRK